MLIIHGTYHFAKKRTAYRHDYCLTCNQFVVAEQYQMFDVEHFFWIPLIPLGTKKRWYCRMCGNDPHARIQNGSWVYLGGAFIFAFFDLMCWAFPATLGLWFGRILFILATVFCIYLYATYKSSVNVGEALQQLPPYPNDNCIYCGSELHGSDPMYCRQCNVERYWLK